MSKEKVTAKERFANLGERLKEDGRLQIDQVKLDLSEKIYAAMQENRITEAELARRLGSSRAYVNKVLQGDTNFTVESLVKIGRAIGCELFIDLARPQPQEMGADSPVKYVIEEPIAEPKFVQSRPDDRKVIMFDFRKPAGSTEIKTIVNQRVKKTYAVG